jgi:hypothetical protein
MKILPFSEGDTFAIFHNRIEMVKQEIESLDNDYVLKASVTELEEYFLDKVRIEPLTLHSDQYYIENKEGTKIDVSHHIDRFVFPGERAIVQGTRLNIAIPYEGNQFLWRVRPSTFSLSSYPEIEIREDSIMFAYSFPDDTADSQRIKADIDSRVRSLSNAVENLRQDVENHNKSAPAIIKSALEQKRAKALSVSNTVANLGIPIKRRDTPPTFTIPATRRKIPIKSPSVPTEQYRPEPVLDLAEYEHILNVIRSMSLVIERGPKSFTSLDEEGIRNHFLIQLNGHYEGGATGETFNASGKTDILIRVEDRNVFIAECKFWRGPKAFTDAIDQLLSYLSWRDSKCALIIFNKTRNSSSVRQKIHEIMESRSEHRRTITYNPDGDSRYILVKESDPGREIIITTLLFDIPEEVK